MKGYFKLNNDGTVSFGNKKHGSDWKELKLLKLQENGKPFAYYQKATNKQGIFKEDRIKIQAALEKEVAVQNKKTKQKELDKLQISLNSVSYDANMEGIGNMGVVIGGMTYKFIKELVKQNPQMQSLYDDIFKQTIEWKGADNKLHTVQVESIAQTLEKAMNEKAKIVFKY